MAVDEREAASDAAARLLNIPDPVDPPEPIASDYIELLTLVLMFILGAPLNLAAYTQVSSW